MNFPGLLLLLLTAAFTCSSQVMNVRKWRPTERDSLDNALAMVDESYYLKALPIFGQLLASHPKEPFLKYSYAKCALQRGDRQHEAYDLLHGVYTKNRKIPEIQFDLALAAFYRFNFQEAEQLLTQFESGRKVTEAGMENAQRLRRYIANARYFTARRAPSQVRVLDGPVNTEFDEYGPAVSADGRFLAFNYAGPRSAGGLQPEDLGEEITNSVYREDINISEKKRKCPGNA